MTRLRKLERDFAQADIAAVTSLLAQLGEEDVMARFGLEARLEELRATVQELDDAGEEQTASAALFFGGRPVVGSKGIESEFGAAAIGRFQDLVSKVLAHESGGLGQRGVVPNKAASMLHITNVVRGSFGFLLEEVQPQQQILEAPLTSAVSEATRLLEAFGEPDEEEFRSAVEAIDQRVLVTARDFFELLRQGGATFRLVVGNNDQSFGTESIVRAADRATSTTLDENEEQIRGQLAGVLPDAHQFEFRALDDRGTIRGKVDKAISADELLQFNRDRVNINSTATIRVKRVFRDGLVVRESYTLLRLELDALG